MDWRSVAQQQDGVVTRRQLVTSGLAPHDVQRLIRRRDLNPVHRGVFVDHTGEPSWRQRAWAAVLYAAPAALWGPSALASLRRTTGADSSGPLHVAVETERRVAGASGVVVHRVVDLRERVVMSSAPWRMQTEEAVLDVAATGTDEFAVIAALTDAVQARLTTPQRLASALGRRARIARRPLMAAVVKDLEEGTESVLEHRYLVQVERPHGLTGGRRQVRRRGSRSVHDVVYDEPRVIVELDGRPYHSLARDRAADLERDTAALLAGYVPVRLGWGQVVGQPCATAARVAAMLTTRGWSGQLLRCPACP